MINIVLIMMIVALIFESGFWDTVDESINEKYPLYHLPHILSCGLCQTWWLTLLYIIITGRLTLLNIALCLVAAHLEETAQNLISILKNWIDRLMKAIDIK